MQQYSPGNCARHIPLSAIRRSKIGGITLSLGRRLRVVFATGYGEECCLSDETIAASLVEES